MTQRNPDGQKAVILLMDCQDSVCRAGWVYLHEGLAHVTEILDLLRALGYLREAEHLFHLNGSVAPAPSVKTQTRHISRLLDLIHDRGLRRNIEFEFCPDR